MPEAPVGDPSIDLPIASPIDTIAALEGAIGRRPAGVDLKVIDHLDREALGWLAVSPLGFLGLGDGRSIALTLAGGAPGFAVANRDKLRLPLESLDDPALVQPGRGFGSLFLAPGVGETLRVNGRVLGVEAGQAVIAVEECYLHCAKALIRSSFWSAGTSDDGPDTACGDPAAFVAASRFLALATIDATGRADLSPKGDPAGRMARIDRGSGGDALWFADRPGNRRTDSFRNIIAQPAIAGALLIPGSRQVAIVTGRARLTADPAACEGFAVEGRTPSLAIRVDALDLTLRDSAALGRAGLWPVGDAPEGIDPPRIFTSHVRLNKDKGFSARLAGTLLSVPGLMRKGLEKDYKSNLY